MEKLNSSQSTQLRKVKSGANLGNFINYEEEIPQTKSATSIKLIAAST